MSTAERRRRRELRRLVLPLAITIGLAFGAVLYGFSVLLTTQGAGGVFSASTLSTGFGGAVLSSGLVAIPVGGWVDRAGIRPVLATGATLIGIGFVAFALASTTWQVLLAWWVLIGPGTAMALFDPAFVALEQWCTPAERNRAAGTLTLITGLAGPIFVPLTTVLQGWLGWRPTAALLGAMVAVAGVLASAVALRAAPRPAPPAPTSSGVVQRAVRAWRHRTSDDQPGSMSRLHTRSFVLLSLAAALAFAALDGIQVHRIARFEASGFTPGVIAGWAATASLLSLPGRVLVPRLASRFDSGKLFTAILFVLVPTLAITIDGTASWQLIAHFVGFGAVFGAAVPMRAVMMGDRYGGATYGRLMGIQAAAIAGGRAVGPASAGWLRDLTGSYGPAMLLLTVAVALAGLACLVVVLTDRR